MEICNLSLPVTNRFATGYLAGSSDIQNYFHYSYQYASAYAERLTELKNRSFERTKLADHIETFMKPFPGSDKIAMSLAKLRQENSVLVVGGQQAGLLTGPMYTIHKIISILTFAKQKEKELGVPVVPLFWIAGEDHDFQEVNHVYVDKNGQFEKVAYRQTFLEKKMISDVTLNKELCMKWVDEVFQTFGETKYTNELLDFIHTGIHFSNTFVDFFAFLIMDLFKEEGLLLLDSGNRNLRKLEKDSFREQICQAEEITKNVVLQQSIIKAAGLPNMIQMNSNAANLFYYDENSNERILLLFDKENDVFFGKNGEIRFTFDELMKIAASSPEQLSNNVVTRPLMQEMLLPVLAFIAGPGEIAYWAELKKAFEWMKMKMPPIVPRLNITIYERAVARDVQDLQMDLDDVLIHGVDRQRSEFLSGLKDDTLDSIIAEMKEQLKRKYRIIAEKLDNGLLPLLEKNESLLLQQIHFLESKIEQSFHRKHEDALAKFKRIEDSLHPIGSPQERVLNIMYFLNKYGKQLVSTLVQAPFSFDGTHKIVKL
ncbi:bacillithiol biosynthesis cysteine-adding enzyme BshC [Bacillaceae bacterium Marseille-Q3522]|nr:bacillithiol biosynthesis cysteine-adding enzyme BshC [Bacillaceae bacterium Marseille-Q3522]